MPVSRILTPYERTQLGRYLGTTILGDIPHDIPIEYITGKIEFCNLVFSISPAALIPRIETEELVHRAQTEIDALLKKNQGKTLTVADVGTGCGAVVITLAKLLDTQSPNSNWLASDISKEALLLAQQNALAVLGKNQPIQFLHSDLLVGFSADIQFDILIANLPYIPQDRIAYLDKSVHAFEPHLALDGGADGLSLIHAFLRQATAHTHAGSVVLLEIDYTHSADDFNAFRHEWLVRVDTDSFTRNRFARLERK